MTAAATERTVTVVGKHESDGEGCHSGGGDVRKGNGAGGEEGGNDNGGGGNDGEGDGDDAGVRAERRGGCRGGKSGGAGEARLRVETA